LVEEVGIPLALVLSGANEHDIRNHDIAWRSIIIKKPDPAEVKQNACEDKAYDSSKKRRWLEKRGYSVHIPYRGIDTNKKSGSKRNPARRWVVERTGRW
jgi:putative transposase